MPPRTKRALPGGRGQTSPSPDPLSLPTASNHHGYDDDGDDEPSTSHLVSFLTGYADHHSSGSGSSDEEGFEPASEGEDDDEDLDVDEDEDGHERGEGDRGGDPGTPSKRAKTGLVGTSTPRKTTPRRRKGSKTPGAGGVTPRKTPRKKVDPLELEAADQEGIIRLSKSDKYFLLASRPSRTSGNSYSALAQPMSSAQYEKHTSSSSSARERLRRLESWEERYPQWSAELDQGFSLMFYGFGSKRNAINRFVQKQLTRKGNVVVINGHFPQLSIRDVLSSIEDTLAIPQDIPIPPSSNTTPIERIAHRLYAHFLPPDSIPKSKRKDYPTATRDLYLIVHSIDSPSLRSPKSFAVLSLLASSPRIKLIATFDHLHTPLLFSPSLNNTPPHAYEDGGWTGTPIADRGFNWIYHNMTTYAPYDLELSYLRLSASSHLSLSTSSSGISEEGALQILRSVPPMAARLLKLLLVKQISNLPPETKHHTAYTASPVAPIFAVDNDTLQSAAKGKFIAREEERYDALIGEYRDHGLVVEAQLDGEGRAGRWVWVPLGKAAIERVLETMKDVEV